MRFFSRLQKISRPNGMKYWSCGLFGVQGSKIGGFSKVMRQRLGLAVALLDKAPLFIFDEHTSGFDTYWESRLKEIIRRKKREGTSVFFASHDLYEVESLADRIAILNEGKLYYLGSVDDLKSKHPAEIRIRVRFETSQDPAGLSREWGVPVTRKGDWFQLICRRDDKVRILRSLEKGGRTLADIRIHETTLEEIYRAISGENPRNGKDRMGEGNSPQALQVALIHKTGGSRDNPVLFLSTAIRNRQLRMRRTG